MFVHYCKKTKTNWISPWQVTWRLKWLSISTTLQLYQNTFDAKRHKWMKFCTVTTFELVNLMRVIYVLNSNYFSMRPRTFQSTLMLFCFLSEKKFLWIEIELYISDKYRLILFLVEFIKKLNKIYWLFFSWKITFLLSSNEREICCKYVTSSFFISKIIKLKTHRKL